MSKTDIAEPAAIQRLPRNQANYPIPWFVEWIDGKPDFRVMDAAKLRDAIRFKLCWICGKRRGVYGSFVIGPMCAVNQTSAEPPSHHECAVYAARVCPFLATPTMHRRERNLPADYQVSGGVMITRNPGVALVWTSRDWHPFTVDNGVLWYIGSAVTVEWFAHGRDATRAEVLDSIDSGLPLLREVAEKEGPEALLELDRLYQRALAYLPRHQLTDSPS